jgi:SAM-dependent methyltransferase
VAPGLSYRPLFVKEFWKRRNEADVLVASRYVAGGSAEMSRVRRELSYLLNRTFRRVLSLPYCDLSSGFRMYHNSEVIEHVPDAPEILTEAWRVLQPGGILILGTPDYGRWMWWVPE